MTFTHLRNALEGTKPDDVEQWCRESVSDVAEAWNTLVPRALLGNRAAAFSYVRSWRALTATLLQSIHAECPDLVLESDGKLFIADVKRSATPISVLVLDAEALEAPFSSWVIRTNDIGLGSCAALVQKLRDSISTLHPVDLDVHGLPHFDFELSEAHLRAFRRNVLAALSSGDQPLEHIQSTLELTITELGELFGVSRQAAAQWRDGNVPGDRKAKVATVAAIVDLLDANLKTDRIPGIARKPAEAYAGLTLLEMIKRDRHEALLESVRESFDWARPA